MLTAENLSYTVAGRRIVDDLSLTLEPSRVAIVVGPNGAGKSTLLKLLTGELTPSAGHIRYGDVAVDRLKPWQLACRRAVMAQATQMAFPFLVHDVVGMALEGIGRNLDAIRRRAILIRCLAAADVSHLARRSYQTLSGGEQQRVQFARALCQLEAGRTVEQQQILFLDEPIASLDLHHQLALLDCVRAVANQGTAVLAILHDLTLAAHHADNLIVLDEGRCAAAGNPDEVLDRALLNRVFKVDFGGDAHVASPRYVRLQGGVSAN